MPEGSSLREKRRQARAREILEAAQAVFGEKGYGGASMEDIAERALLTRVSLYNYFRDKGSLLQALLGWKREELLERLRSHDDPQATVAARLERVILETLRFQHENRGVLTLFLSGGLPELLGTRPLESYVDLLAELLQEGMNRGELAPLPPVPLAQLLAGLLFTDTLKSYVLLAPHESLSLKEEGALIARVFLKGIISI